MNRLDKLYQKALQGAKDKRSRESLEQGVKYMAVWVDIVSYGYTHDLKEPYDDIEAHKAYFREVGPKCGHEFGIEEFIEWYFRGDNDAVFITRDYGDGELEFGY